MERELAELLDEDNIEVTAVPDSNPEIEELKQRLQDLCMEGKYCKIYYYISENNGIYDIGLVSSGKDVAALPAVPSNKKKVLKEPECL